MMNCTETRRLLSAFLDNEVPARLGEEIRAHLGTCPSCRWEWQLLSQLDTRLKKLPDIEAGLAFTARVMGRIKEKEQPRFLPFLTPAFAYSIVFLVFLVIGFFLAGTLYRNGRTDSQEKPIFTRVLLESQDLNLINVQYRTLARLSVTDGRISSHEKPLD